MNTPVTVKLIATKNFEVELLQLEDGAYTVRYQRRGRTAHHYTDDVSDLSFALKMFDLKLREMEGN